MTIGKLAKEAGVGVETIRFYERKELIKRAAKDGAFRQYPREEVSRVRFIKRAQELGFTLRELKDLLDIQFKRKLTGSQVKERAQEKLKEIRSKIDDLKRMEKSLMELSRLCGEGEQAIRECYYPALNIFPVYHVRSGSLINFRNGT